jgi:hypothetical protein
MQAILKNKHRQFCDWLERIKARQAVPDHKLNELESELLSVYMSYQQKMDELREIVFLYEEKQKAIKNEVKRNRKYSFIS